MKKYIAEIEYCRELNKNDKKPRMSYYKTLEVFSELTTENVAKAFGVPRRFLDIGEPLTNSEVENRVIRNFAKQIGGYYPKRLQDIKDNM